MGDSIHKVDYYYVELSDKPGEALRILLGLKEAGVNLLACSGFPIDAGKAQLDLVPEHDESFRKAASRLDLSLSERKRAFLVQEGERVGALADIFAKLASKNINIVSSHAVSAGAGRWGMMLWVRPEDYDKASEALGF